MHHLKRAATGLLIAAFTTVCAAESVLRVIVPFPPGGGGDLMGRVLAEKLRTPQQSVIIENKPGANGNIGAQAVAQAKDGAVLLTTDAVVTVNPELFRVNAFDASKSLVPLACIGAAPSVLVVPKSSPIHSVADFVAAARAKELTYASGGLGSAGHLTMAYFGDDAKLKLLHVPFNGGAPAMAALVAGQVDGAFVLLASAFPQISGGQLRALAVSSDAQIPQLPGVPTMVEAGYPNFKIYTRMVVMAPKSMPKAEVQDLESRLRKVNEDSDFAAKLQNMGMLPPAEHSAAQTASMLDTERTRWTDFMRRYKISAR